MPFSVLESPIPSKVLLRQLLLFSGAHLRVKVNHRPQCERLTRIYLVPMKRSACAGAKNSFTANNAKTFCALFKMVKNGIADISVCMCGHM